MGLGAKLNFAFLAVILVMVLSHAGAQYLSERNTAMAAAHKIVDPAIRQLTLETETIQRRNESLATKLATDSAFNQAYQAKDRGALAAAIKSFVERTGMPGYVAVIDDRARIYYSSDAPAKFGYPARDIPDYIQQLLHETHVWYGPAALTATGTFSVVGMVPIKSGQNITGLVAICQPINTEFLTGLQKKVEITQGLSNLDLLLFSVKDGRVLAMTPGLSNNDGGFVDSLNREGVKAIKTGEMEKLGRLWRTYQFETTDRKVLAVVVVTTMIPKLQLAAIAGQAGVAAFVAILLSVMFSAGISGRFNRSLEFLAQRAKDLAAQKKDMPSLEGLGSEFILLAEVIDTAVTSPRSSVRSLQTQMTKHQDALEEKQQQVDAASGQVEAVNRQLTIQSKQLSEISKQINHANAQSILLQQKLASVLQISTEAFLILDPYGNVLSTNPVFMNWYGCQEAEIAGRFCFDLVRRPGEPPQGDGDQTAFSQHGGNPGDLIAQFFPEGTIYHQRQEKSIDVLAHLQPIMTDDQNIQGYVLVLRDKSFHSEANRLRKEIVAMLQESIRAPLAVAEQKWPTVLTTSKQYSGTPLGPALIDLHANYQAVMGVVDSLLMVHTGIVPISTTPKEQVSVTRLIGDCLEHSAQQARSHQIMLDYKTVTGLPSTSIDKDILRDIVIQLLEKMISVTAPGGRVRVESISKNNEIRLSLFSSGPALAPTEIEDMFAGFIQGKHSEDTYSSRLSLYLVRNNLERLGGKIWAESDRGTYFYLTVPVQ